MPLVLTRTPVHVVSAHGAVRRHLRWGSLSVGIGIAQVRPGGPHVGPIGDVVRGRNSTHHTVLALARGAHTVTGVGVGELPLQGSVF